MIMSVIKPGNIYSTRKKILGYIVIDVIRHTLKRGEDRK
jgi:hypothetical protein